MPPKEEGRVGGGVVSTALQLSGALGGLFQCSLPMRQELHEYETNKLAQLNVNMNLHQFL